MKTHLLRYICIHGVLVCAINMFAPELLSASEENGGSEQKQIPYIKGLVTLRKNFQFAPGQAWQIASLESPSEWASLSPAKDDDENALWTEVQKGNSKDDYEAYLTQYPKGKYAALARSRIKKLLDEVAAEATRRDKEAWEAAEKAGTEEAYQNYLNNNASGLFAPLVPIRLAKIKREAIKLEKEKGHRDKDQQLKDKEKQRNAYKLEQEKIAAEKDRPDKLLEGTWKTSYGAINKIYEGKGSYITLSDIHKMYGFYVGEVTFKDCNYYGDHKFICSLKVKSPGMEEWVKCEISASASLLKLKFLQSSSFGAIPDQVWYLVER